MSYNYKPDIKYSESEYNRSTLSNIQPTNLIYEENKRLHEELLEKNLEIQEIQTELSAIKQLVDNKEQLLSKLKEDIRQSTLINNKAVGEQRFLQEEILSLQRDQEKLLSEYESVLTKIEDLASERLEKNKYIDYLEGKNKTLEQNFFEMRSQTLTLEVELQE